ncbi:MAG: hypothetical protein IT232_06705, partial [Flavobacteriales bacterium]|nr:hypothetical protein [Flavobacteriales bacterium]
MRNFFSFVLAFCFIIFTIKVNGQGATCTAADPFCTINSYTFPNSTGTSTGGGNDYGCLSTQPNPAWYYMEIDNPGDIEISISQVDNSGNGIDVDFILYGPFANLATAMGQCGDLGNPGGCSGDHNCSGEIIDCSYDPAPTETATLTGATTGQVYIMLLTNYSNVPGQISFEQTSGSGSTNCDIVFPPSCGTIDFHAEQNAAPYNIINPFPSTMTCEDDWIYLVANDSNTAGGYITPSLHFQFTPTNDPNDYVTVYSGGSGALGSGTLLGNWSLNDGIILTLYGEYMSPSTQYYYEICQETSVDYFVYDGGTGTIYASGTTADGAGCTRYGPFSPAGTAAWSTSAPGASVGANDAGLMYFDPAVAGPGTYSFQYSWNNTAGCSGSAIKNITVTNPYTFTSLTYSTACKPLGGTASPTLNATAGGTYSSATLGASLNTTTGAVNIATAPVGTHTITYLVGTMPCGATGTGTITIINSNTASAPSSNPTVCVNTAITPITHTTTGATGIGAPTGLPAGVTANWSGGTIT